MTRKISAHEKKNRENALRACIKCGAVLPKKEFDGLKRTCESCLEKKANKNKIDENDLDYTDWNNTSIFC